jgi:16S rRNA (cytosine967-C5)-methyltransferase
MELDARQGIRLSNVKSGANSFRKPRPDLSRLISFQVLTEVNEHEAYANLLLPKVLSETQLEKRDKGFITELVYGTLRMQGRHDWILSQVSDRPWSEVDAGIANVARLGLHQLFEMRVPTHAAVSATVEVARKVLGESKATYVNALLRKVSARSLDEWMSELEASFRTASDPVSLLAIKYSHPEWIVSAYFDLLRTNEEVEAALVSNNIPASPTLVSWPGRSTQQELVALGGVATKYSPYGASSVDVPSDIGLIKGRKAGVQDEGSQIVASVFARAAVGKNSWLDLCAGPGGKAALVSSLAEQAGASFTANEVSQSRADLVRQVVVKGEVLVGDGRTLFESGTSYDAVLADVPCTGIGALRRRPEVRWRRKPSDLPGLTQLQRELFDGAVAVTNVGGIIAYATCSPHLAETKVQVTSALKRHPNLRSVPIDDYLPKNLEGATVNGSMQLWTHRHGTDAMFLSLFERIS